MFEESKHPRDKDGKFTNKNNATDKSINELKAELATNKPNLKAEQKPIINPIFDTPEDREVIDNISKGFYYSVDAIKNLPTFKKMDKLAIETKLAVGKKIGVPSGETIELNTPERQKQREGFINDFINGTGEARTRPNALKKEYKLTLVVGLPASGKSKRIAEPLSMEQGAFIFDSDEMKRTIPEYLNGANGGGVHEESKMLLKRAEAFFTNGEMKGTNLVYPIIGDDGEKNMKKLKPFIDAGYDVEIAYKSANTEESMNRALMRGVKDNRPFAGEVLMSYDNDKIVAAYKYTLAQGIKKSKYSEL